MRLAEAQTPDGGALALFRHDESFAIFLDGKELMHSHASASELLLGRLGAEPVRGIQPQRILIGGLGLGFTLRGALESLNADARVRVVELLPAVVDWNRDQMRNLNGELLSDPRVEVEVDDVVRHLRAAPDGGYDRVLLDVDNGPVAMVSGDNASLYSAKGLRELCRVVKSGGRIIVWSAARDRPFEARMRAARLRFEGVPAKVHPGAKRATHVLYVIERP